REDVLQTSLGLLNSVLENVRGQSGPLLRNTGPDHGANSHQGPPSADEKQPSPDPATLGEETSPGIHRCSHSVIRTEYRRLTMEFGLILVFLVAILRGNLWRTGDLDDVRG
ncbi:hypothetical protein HPG69_006828, partial [Diceros bicornis minor]